MAPKRTSDDAGLEYGPPAKRRQPPRPPNCFMLFKSGLGYLRDLQAPTLAEGQVGDVVAFLEERRWLKLEMQEILSNMPQNNPDPNRRQANFCKRAGCAWKAASKQCRDAWIFYAAVCLKLHSEAYPDYKYTPRNSGSCTGKKGKGKDKAHAPSSPAFVTFTPYAASTSSSSPSFSPGSALATPCTTLHQFGGSPAVVAAGDSFQYDYGYKQQSGANFDVFEVPYTQGPPGPAYGYAIGTMSTPLYPSSELSILGLSCAQYETQPLVPVDATVDTWWKAQTSAAPPPPTNIEEEGSRALLGNGHVDYSPRGTFAPLDEGFNFEAHKDSPFAIGLGDSFVGLNLGGSPAPMTGLPFDDMCFGASIPVANGASDASAHWSRSPVVHASPSFSGYY